MTSGTLQRAIAQFQDQLVAAGDCGRVGQGSAKSIAAADAWVRAPNALRESYSSANPIDLKIPWVAEWLTLYSIDELYASQVGYRYATGSPDLLPGWDPNWIVIGGASSDPIIADGSSSLASVLMGVHGIGAWSPRLITPSLADFLILLSRWLELYRFRGGVLLDSDRVLLPDVAAAIERDVAGHLPPPARRNFLSFICE